MDTNNALQLLQNGNLPAVKPTTSLEIAYEPVSDDLTTCKQVLHNRRNGTALRDADDIEMRKVVIAIRAMIHDAGVEPVMDFEKTVDRWAAELAAAYPVIRVEEIPLALSPQMVHRSGAKHFGRFSIGYLLEVMKFYRDWSFKAMQKANEGTEFEPAPRPQQEAVPEGRELAVKHWKLWNENKEGKHYRVLPEFLFNMEPVLRYHVECGRLSSKEIIQVYSDTIAILNEKGWIKDEYRFTEVKVGDTIRVIRELRQNFEMDAQAQEASQQWDYFRHQENNFAKALANLKLCEYLYENKLQGQ